jgi:hypothetical protein
MCDLLSLMSVPGSIDKLFLSISCSNFLFLVIHTIYFTHHIFICLYIFIYNALKPESRKLFFILFHNTSFVMLRHTNQVTAIAESCLSLYGAVEMYVYFGRYYSLEICRRNLSLNSTSFHVYGVCIRWTVDFMMSLRDYNV